MLGRIFLTTPLCFHDNSVCLVAELGGDLPVSGQHLGGRVNFFAVTGRVRGDLRGLRPLIPGLFQMLAYLLAAGAGGVKVLLCVASNLRCATASRFNFVTEVAEPIRQFRLIYGGGKLL